MQSALYGVYTLVVLSVLYQKLTCSFSDTPQLVCKHRSRALSMKYSICIYRCFKTQDYIYPFQNLSPGFTLKIFLKLRKLQPRYSYNKSSSCHYGDSIKASCSSDFHCFPFRTQPAN